MGSRARLAFAMTFQLQARAAIWGVVKATQHAAYRSRLWWLSALVVSDAVEDFTSSSIVSPDLAQQGVRSDSPVLIGTKEHYMFATIRRYDGVDVNRSAELTRKVNETLSRSSRSCPGSRATT